MTRPYTRALGHILLLLLVAAGCSKKQSPAAPEVEMKPAEPEAKEAPDTTDPPVGLPTVTVLSAGKQPHQPLRWRFRKGFEQEITVQMSSSVAATVDGRNRASNPTPPVVTVTAFKVDDVGPDGAAQVSFTVRDAKPADSDGFDPSTVAMMERSMKEIIGVRGSYRVSDRAFVERVELEPPPNAQPAVKQTIETLRQTIRQVLTPLPEEPIGVGGKWAVEQKYEYSGMRIAQRAVFEVQRLDANGADVTGVTEQSAPTQPITGANGQAATLQSLSSESKGSASWVFDELAPRAAKSDTSMNMALTASGRDGTEHEMSMLMEMTMSLVGTSAPQKAAPTK